MASQALFPHSEQSFDTKNGRHYKIFDVAVPTASESHEVILGENGVGSLALLNGAGTLSASTVPAGTSLTGGISTSIGGITDTDQNHRVAVTVSTAGTYRFVAEFRGRNAAGL